MKVQQEDWNITIFRPCLADGFDAAKAGAIPKL